MSDLDIPASPGSISTTGTDKGRAAVVGLLLTASIAMTELDRPELRARRGPGEQEQRSYQDASQRLVCAREYGSLMDLYAMVNP